MSPPAVMSGSEEAASRPAMVALDTALMMVMAAEPATPTPAAPTPETAWVEMVWPTPSSSLPVANLVVSRAAKAS